MDNQRTALYRKYRPERFADVRNQEPIVKVLEGSIQKNMIPHALLFTGSRGTGKTTVARIFARAIGAKDVDIYEIDAASNRGIDDIRELKESVHTVPFDSPYKVYIIDEVHMLSKDAFNALLKTLEEPPAHVVFILATTEKDKVLSTIISRCQVFEFRAPSCTELESIVEDVVKKEGCTLEVGTAHLIALAADGSYRDALGITQKVLLASGDTNLTLEEVSEIIGAPRSTLLDALLFSLAKKDITKGLDALAITRKQFIDMKILNTLLLERVRTIILLRYDAHESETLLSSYSEDEQKLLRQYAEESRETIHSHLLIKMIEMSEMTGKSLIQSLPLELLILEHAAP